MRVRRSRARFLSAAAVPVIALAILVALPPRVRAAAPELSFSPTLLRFGEMVVGQTQTLLVVATNNGQSKVTISSVSANEREFKVSHPTLPLVLAAGESLAINLTFAPTVTGWRGGEITLVSDATDPILTVPFEGTGVAREGVTVSPRDLAFGNVAVGASSKLPVILTNTSPGNVTIARVRTQGRAFSVSGATFPLTLAAGQELKLEITFKPQTVGPAGGNSFIAGSGLGIAFTGVGVSEPQLAVTPATLNFGDVAVGTTEKRTVELSASGGSVTISSVSSSSAQFAVLDTPFPLTVPAGKGVSLTVAFTPKNSGQPSATLSFTSDAAVSPTHSALIGTGTAAFVSLSWIASTSAEVAGYNIYRKTSLTGSYARLNSKLDPDTSYTDATVLHGTTYYYATTAVNSKGKESDYSNRVEVVVP
jgi:Abnormal spindle-like microcephaly-assoc'd, ASPM-SPD-2-Hydin